MRLIRDLESLGEMCLAFGLLFGARKAEVLKPTPIQPALPMEEQLLSYWISHPAAQGTIEAIVEWWLLEQRIQQAVAEVRSALVELVEKKFVVECPQMDGRTHYQLNQKKIREIRAWLAKQNPK